MRPMIEKLPVAENRSFVAATHATPRFEVPWHQHVEYELILFTEGEGTSYIGNYVGDFKPGDIFFLGCNLPHTFQKANAALYTSAVVVHFKEDFWGKDFLEMPEAKGVKELLAVSAKGIQIEGKTKIVLQKSITALEKASGFESVIQLCQCLHAIHTSGEYKTVSTQDVYAPNTRFRERIDTIFNYTIAHFRDNITLEHVASNAGMSVPAFCNYFKKSTKKTYVEFLNEVKVGHACKLLMDTQMTVEQICYDSGYSTPANFNKQFLRLKKLTPSQYRKKFMKRIE